MGTHYFTGTVVKNHFPMLNNIFDKGAKSHDELIHRFIGL